MVDRSVTRASSLMARTIGRPSVGVTVVVHPNPRSRIRVLRLASSPAGKSALEVSKLLILVLPLDPSGSVVVKDMSALLTNPSADLMCNSARAKFLRSIVSASYSRGD